MDIWASNMPESLIASGFEMFYNPAQMNIASVQAYDGVDIAGGPWDGSFTQKIPGSVYGPGSYTLGLAQLNCVTPDAGGDVILAKVTFQCEVSGIADVTLNPITDVNTTVGCLSGTVYDAQMGTDTISITQGLECGNGILEQVAEVYWEECDDGNTLNGDCCSSTCQINPNGSSCSDGICCNGTDTCTGGSCSTHAGNPYPDLTAIQTAASPAMKHPTIVPRPTPTALPVMMLPTATAPTPAMPVLALPIPVTPAPDLTAIQTAASPVMKHPTLVPRLTPTALPLMMLPTATAPIPVHWWLLLYPCR